MAVKAEGRQGLRVRPLLIKEFSGRVAMGGRIVVGVLVFAMAGGLARAEVEAPAVDLSQYRGKVVYIDFWASWCGPCKISFPYMQEMLSVYPKSDFAVVAVNLDTARDRADRFLDQVGAHVPVVYDPKGVIASKFDIKAMPTSILIGRDGRVRYVHQGFFSEKIPSYQAHISELIHERP